MLIRSQDKTKLINLNMTLNIHIEDQRDGTFTIWCEFPYAHDVIGVYSTEAKAIKVLDMIQMAYFKVEKMKMIYSHSGELSNSCIQDFSFVMPSDEEVEE